jgi:hypothetical protein
MVPRVLTASSGLASWSMTVDRTSAAWRKIQPLMGVERLAPPGLPPLPGERGVTFANFHDSKKKLGRNFYRAKIIIIIGVLRNGHCPFCLLAAILYILSNVKDISSVRAGNAVERTK